MALKPGSTSRIPVLERELGEWENSEKDREGWGETKAWKDSEEGDDVKECKQNNQEQQEGVKIPNV